MEQLQDDIQHIIREYFKIVGCGTCQNKRQAPYCNSCSMNKNSGSYYCVSEDYAKDIAETITLLIKEEGFQ
jgi:recombinational DNA repair protein RecR